MGQPFLLTKYFLNTVKKRGQHPALMEKVKGVYTSITYQQMNTQVEQVASFFIHQGLESQDKVALLSENRAAWPITDMGVIFAGLVDVPLYPTLTGKQIAYILNNSGCKGIILSKFFQLDKIVGVFKDVPTLEFIVVMDEYTPIELGNIRLLSYQEMLDEGRSYLEETKAKRERRLAEAKEDDVVSIIYTSGTTGDPKGVMLTHKNFASNGKAACERIGVDPEALGLSFLPLSHVLERVLNYSFQYMGATIAYAESIDTISQNMQEIKPTNFAGVPRVFEKIYNRVIDSIESGSPLKKKIFSWALGVGQERTKYILDNKPIPPLLAFKYALATKLVFQKIHARTGGNVQYVISGGAPLMKEIAEFFFAVGIPVYEGYGLTESSPVIACNCPGAVRPGTVGNPLPGVEVKIAEDGEILARGPNIMKGYYNMPEATAEAIDADGWLHTGDIGELSSDNFLRITDRKKELIIMSNGKNVAPQPIENLLKTSPLIEQAVLLGNNQKYIAALIFPNYDNLRLQLPDLKNASAKEMATHEQVNALIRRELDTFDDRLARYEQIKKFHLLAQELTQEDGFLTPTLKYMRRVIHEKFADEIQNLFQPEEAVSNKGVI